MLAEKVFTLPPCIVFQDLGVEPLSFVARVNGMDKVRGGGDRRAWYAANVDATVSRNKRQLHDLALLTVNSTPSHEFSFS